MSAFLERLADRLNPLIVQELRRGLRARLFTAAFLLLLTACVVVALVSYGIWASSGGDTVGAGSFVAFYACLASVCFFILPLSAFRALAREQEDHTWPLLVLTNLRPRQLLAGKIGSNLLQALLYGSAVAPFLLFSYLLQGVGLVTVGLVFGLSLAWQVFVTVLAVSAATLAGSRFWRGILQFAVLFVLAWATVAAVSLVAMLVSEFTGQEELLAALGFAAWAMVAYGAIFFAVAVGRLTFESDNRVLWTRLALLFHFMGSALLCSLFVWLASGVIHDADVVAVPLLVIGVLNSCVAGFFMTTGPAGEPRRQRAVAGRLMPGLLRPGLARAFRLFVLLVAGFAGGGAILGHASSDYLQVTGAIACYAVLFLSLPLAIGRGLLERLLPGPVGQRIFCAATIAAGMGAPPLLALMLGRDADDLAFNFLNPVFGIERVSHSPDLLWGLAPIAIACALGAHQVLLRRDREANEAQDRARGEALPAAPDPQLPETPVAPGAA